MLGSLSFIKMTNSNKAKGFSFELRVWLSNFGTYRSFFL